MPSNFEPYSKKMATVRILSFCLPVLQPWDSVFQLEHALRHGIERPAGCTFNPFHRHLLLQTSSHESFVKISLYLQIDHDCPSVIPYLVQSLETFVTHKCKNESFSESGWVSPFATAMIEHSVPFRAFWHCSLDALF